MRYIDTGQRDPKNSLGFWLQENALKDESVVALRWQSGFFGAHTLGYFLPLMARLRSIDGALGVVVGSNDGATPRADVEALLSAAGPPRDGQRVGVVSFENAYFHPKVVHLARADGSAAAYVGSANLTRSGVTSLHVEAGVLLDTDRGDDAAGLAEIAGAVDWWFQTPRPGLHVVSLPADLDELARDGILDRPRPLPAPPVRSSVDARPAGRARLAPLVSAAPLPPGLRPAATAAVEDAPLHDGIDDGFAALAASGPIPVAEWRKVLTPSDAQRKATGNQRGSITLTKAGYAINPQTYFRHELFGLAEWTHNQTSTGEVLETTNIAFAVTFLGRHLGYLDLEITYAPNRESAQRNYTSLLHLGGLGPFFTREDLTGRLVCLERMADRTYSLAIE